jgi:hypothetical protein
MPRSDLEKWNRSSRRIVEIEEKLAMFERRLNTAYPPATLSPLDFARIEALRGALTGVIVVQHKVQRVQGRRDLKLSDLLALLPTLVGTLSRSIRALDAPASTSEDEPESSALDEWARKRTKRAGNEVEREANT